MASSSSSGPPNPKVGPKLKVSVPSFRRTDFSGDIDRLGGLSARTRLPPPGLDSARGDVNSSIPLSDRIRRDPAAEDRPLLLPGPQGQHRAQHLAPDVFEGVLKEDNMPLETFDDTAAFEVHTPEEWLEITKGDNIKPTASVLHYLANEWSMVPCWVKDYDAAGQRYIVEMQDGKRKRVKRLCLRFNAEDAANFALRVETCRAKKAHCELQTNFIRYIDGQRDAIVSPMRRDHKEHFIRQCLHKSHVQDSRNHITTIRSLILEIEQSYVLALKFAKVKDDLIEYNGTPKARVKENTPYGPLLRSFLPRAVPERGLITSDPPPELTVDQIVDNLLKQPTMCEGHISVTMSIWRRFQEEVSKHRILDTTRHGPSSDKETFHAGKSLHSDTSEARVFDPDTFMTHMEEHRKDVTVTLERHWRDYIVSEILDKMSETHNFFVDNPQKYLRLPLHRALRKFDLILNSQMRWFVQNSIDSWVDFMRTFVPSPTQCMPPPLLTLRLQAQNGEVVIIPPPDEMITRIPELIDAVTKVTSSIMSVEYELVPFCNLPQTLMYEIGNDASLIKDAKEATQEIIVQCLERPKEVMAMYQKYAYLLSEEVVDLDELDVDSVRERTEAYLQAGLEVEQLTATVMKFPFFELHCDDIIQALSQEAYQLAYTCLATVAQSVHDRTDVVLNEWRETHERILSNPEDEEELARLKEFMADINQLKTKPLMATTRHIHQQIDLLANFSFEVESDIVERAFSSFAWPLQVQIDVSDSERSLDSQKQRFMDKLELEKNEFNKDMIKYQDELTWVKSLKEYTLAATKYAHRINALRDNLDRAKERVRSYEDREKLFGMEVSDYSELEVMNEGFEPYFKLWTAAIEFKHSSEDWLNGPLSKLNAVEIDQVVEEQFKECYKTIKQFEGQENPRLVAQALRDDIAQFRQNLPVIRALCQEAFQPMHFAMLFDELDRDPDMEEGLTLQQMLDINIVEHIEVVERISAEALKQHGLKVALGGMKRDWKPIELEVVAYKESGTFVIKGTDVIQALLDEHIVKTQAIRGSPFVKPIEKEVKDWEVKLLYIQDLLEQWLTVQRSWLYLEPIFGSDDIQRQMPNEAKRFQQVNTLWRSTMETVFDNPNVLDVSDIENLLASFTDANKKLEVIQKGLNDYLETKRLAFPRFFFLSNEELLMILSQTKDPTAVQPHMGKCFEGINRVRFSDSNEIIEAMLSVEGEVVELDEPVNVVEGEKKGNVEVWLREVQNSMIDSLTKVTAKALTGYATTERTKWVLEWPGQVVICIDNVYWTQEVATAIDSGKLEDYVGVSVNQLAGLVELVRGDLSKLNRQTLGALVTIDVHNRDVVEDLHGNKVSSSREFDWISQLRYYWRPAGSITLKETGKPSKVDKCQVCIINAMLYYGFEYLGNSDRLVITPLTDRCYRTLMGAFHLYYGGGPEGPAGTGKTESTKDLAKAVAVQCVVFNCSDGLDYIAMGKFFKGIASSGAWCCFDEFNRINLEVLSVVSSQVQAIQFAIRDKKQVFLFEGTEIELVPSCAVNITMNPGYAGRAELPDNLKALFRPCAMMVPDYALIGEIVLYSYGFEAAKVLSRKAVGSLRLSSEQLSSQEHYDFGMRALKSILVRAGALRRMYGNTRPESVLALSALNDVNLPKFTANDIPLFLGITGDLFPGVELPPSDYGKLIGELEGAARSLTLQPEPGFMKKCIQLWETIMVRHGLMLVGATISGKTEVENVLAKALAAVSDGGDYLPVQMHKINPKSIKQGQLYGDFDENTHEWTDGILALAVRFAATADPGKRQWVMLDGPVDAIWIENMNTVLDDNKKLCLNSGEIIKLTPVTTMMFEVEDLAAASPATVSRCGMVFSEQVDIGWKVLTASWCERLPDRIKDFAPQMHKLFEGTIDKVYEMCSRKVKQPLVINLHWLVMNLLHLYLALLSQDLKLEEAKDEFSAKEKELKIDNLFWLSLFWSFACTTDEYGRGTLNTFIRDLGSGKLLQEKYQMICPDGDTKLTMASQLPEEGTIHDYFPNPQTNKWEPWTKRITSFDIPKEAQVHTVIVPTVDTVRNAFLLQTLLKKEYHVLLCGPTGTGKTVAIQQELHHNFDREVYVSMSFAFSAQTSANQTQDMIDGKMEKRRKNSWGPPLGKRCLLFIDDLNMPAKEKYGAQPPIELLRQWMDTGGWYDRKTSDFRTIVDVSFIGAMGPPGAGRPHVTNRYQRHFNLVFVLNFEAESMVRIFSSIMQWFLSKFPSQVSSLGQSVVKATVDIFESMTTNMLPTPAKSHYTFNLRDLSKVHQGICLCTKNSLPTSDDLIKCWAHECQRVFEDRLVNGEDHAWFNNKLKEVMEARFKKQWKQVVKVEPLIFGDFHDQKHAYYQEIVDHHQLSDALQNYLMDYNQMAKQGMELVLFLAAVQHVCRIVRILKTPLGNGLLVGVGGSGRKSLANLSTFVADQELYQVEISKNYGSIDWYDDLKRLLMRVGGNAKEVAFLLSDTQIPKESFLEDISSVLNNGEVPNLFNAEDKTQILEVCSAPAAQAGHTSMADIFVFFVEQCRKNLHMVLALSPIGENFRRRVRMFPALVNCCTIDWFMPWPDAALRSVADHFLHKVDLAEEVFGGVVEICVEMHKSVSVLVNRFQKEVQRHYYVTPTSYLELIRAFRDVLQSKRNDVSTMKGRYDEGLDKLLGTEEQVKTMSIELEELRPILKKTSQETADLMVVIEKKQAEASMTAAVVSKEEEAATAQAEEARAMKEECQADLDKALPALNAALDALKNLKKADITEVKNMKTPPDGVIIVSKALCWCFNVAPKKVTASDGRTKFDDFWEPSKKKLWGDPKLAERLMDYDKDNIPPDIMEKLKPLEEDPNFEPETVKKGSVAAYGICKWVRAMIVYDGVAKVVGPKRAALNRAESDLAQVQAVLAEKKAELKAVQDNVAQLVEEFETARNKKEELSLQVEDCTKKLSRAEKLINGLGGEKVRWTESSARLGGQYNNLTGDVLIASGIIAYLGTFMGKYRQATIHSWVQLMHDQEIPASQEFALRNVIGSDVAIRQWVIDKLPNDQVSIENALILSRSRRWPLMIDPQLQANNWIRKTHAEGLKIIRLSQPNYARDLEFQITNGRPVLLENLGETLDPLLDPLLQKAKFKAGNIVMIRLGDSTIEYNEDFRFYMITKLPNPHYSPEICVQVTLLNFMATPDGLEDQMLGILVAREEPEVEKKRQNLIVESANSKAQLKEIEDRILELLSNAKGNILDDEELINTLSTSRIASLRIEERVSEQEKTQAIVQETRDTYVPVAVRSSALFFVVADLCNVEPMYQYSLEWFYSIYDLAIGTAEKFERNVQKRLQALQSQFLRLIFEKTCDSLFEKDKLMFSLLLCFKSMEVDQDINQEEKNLLLLACGGTGSSIPKPKAEWLTEVSWDRICELDKLARGPWNNFANSFKQNLQAWQAVFDADNPLDVAWPGGLKDSMTPLQKSLVLVALRPDCTVQGLQEVIATKLGKDYLEPPSFDLEKSFEDSNSTTPLIFVLSSGADPMAEIIRLAHKMGMNNQRESVSLGQGQGKKAERAILEGKEQGFWVILQNCHLAASWMGRLEVMVEELKPEDVQEQFRLWLTAMPSPAFPVSVLQNGLKMTNEPPKGLKFNLLRGYLSIDRDWFEEAGAGRGEECQHAFRKMLFGLCFFHASIQERCIYGPLGWNIPYQFSEPDRQICMMQLRMFLEENENIPYMALRYTASEANYGGRVTDSHDRRTINNLITDFYCADILKDEYKFSPSGAYYAPVFSPYETYVEYIRSLPINQMPEAFGLHSNANLVAAISEAMRILRTANSLMPKTGSGEGTRSPDAILTEATEKYLKAVAGPFDCEFVEAKYPMDYKESMNTVLNQELLRFNKLVIQVRSTLVDVGKAVKGLVVMSQELDEVASGILANTTPGVWKAVSYPSLKPLSSYVTDLCARLKFFQDWIDAGLPSTFWLSGFYFTQSFLTGQLQNYARKFKLEIDTLTWNFKVQKQALTSFRKPETGCLVYGIFMDGARWDDIDMVIAESFAKVLFCELPHIHLTPCEVSKDGVDKKTTTLYPCPIYKTSERKGVLLTTGHSTNFVMTMLLPMSSQHTEKHWVKRGVACLTQLDD